LLNNNKVAIMIKTLTGKTITIDINILCEVITLKKLIKKT